MLSLLFTICMIWFVDIVTITNLFFIIHIHHEELQLYISRIEFIILELSINNKFNNEHEVKKSERGKRGNRKRIMNKQEINESIEKENRTLVLQCGVWYTIISRKDRKD